MFINANNPHQLTTTARRQPDNPCTRFLLAAARRRGPCNPFISFCEPSPWIHIHNTAPFPATPVSNRYTRKAAAGLAIAADKMGSRSASTHHRARTRMDDVLQAAAANSPHHQHHQRNLQQQASPSPQRGKKRKVQPAPFYQNADSLCRTVTPPPQMQLLLPKPLPPYPSTPPLPPMKPKCPFSPPNSSAAKTCSTKSSPRSPSPREKSW